MFTLRHTGIAVSLALATSPVAAQELTGIWRDDRGGRYVVRQAGEEFCWTSEMNVYCGLITGPVIAGSWLDLPTGRFRGNGRMVLRIASSNRLVKLHQTANYAGSTWTREGSSETASVPPTPAPRPPAAPPPSQPATAPSSSQPIGGPRAAPADIDGGTKDWTYRSVGSDYRSMTGKRIQFTCGPDPAPTEWRALFGTDIYTDDSVLCQAGVHAGVIGPSGGTVTIEILPGRSSYTGSRQYGVISGNYPPWGGSFAFREIRENVSYDVLRTPRPPSSTPRSEPSVVAERTAGYAETPQDFGKQIGARVRYTCTRGVQYLNRVWGTDVYTLDSVICAAAVHAGVLRAGEDGKVVVEIRAAQESFRGSFRNGITSSDYPGFPVSYAFVK